MNGQNIDVPMPTSLAAAMGACVQKPRRAEWLAAVGMLLVFWAFHAATYNWYPACWCDEVTFSEPALNLSQGRGFTTWIWQFQPAGTFWAVNTPLYSFLLSGWVRAAGTSLLAARSFDFTLFALAVLLLWLASWRLGMVTSARARLTLIALAESGYGISLASRSSRPDVLGMVVLLLLLVALGLEDRRWRGWGMLGLAALTPWVGLQVALYAVLVCFLGWLVREGVRLGDLLRVGLGALAGGGLLAAFLALKGALAHFELSAQAVSRTAGFTQLGGALASTFKDLSCVPLVLGLGCLAAFRAGPWPRPSHRIFIMAALICLVVPAVFSLSGHFSAYYAYLIYLPLLLAFGHADSQTWSSPSLQRPALARSVVVGAAAAALCLGLPLRLLMTAAFCHVTPRAQLMEVVAAYVHPGDVVFSEYYTFFEAKHITPKVYVPFSTRGLSPMPGQGLELTPQQREQVSVMIVSPGQKDSIARYFGGQWFAVSEPFGDSVALGNWPRLPVLGRWLQTLFSHAPAARFKVQIFRRTPDLTTPQGKDRVAFSSESLY